MNKEIRYCEICGVSSLEKGVTRNKQFGMCLCDKHLGQMKRFGEVKDHNKRCVFDPNEIRLLDDYAEIDTYDQYGNVMITYKVDKEDIKLLEGRKWRTVYKDKTMKPYLITGNQNTSVIDYFHRLVMEKPEEKEVDHINGDSSDNRKSNLRILEKTENQLNMKKKKDNTSGIRGVSFDKKEQRWKIDFSYKKQRHYFKKWDKIEQAVYLRYLCEVTFQKSLRHTSNDELIFEHINKLSEEEKSDIKNYFESKINTSKDGVENDIQVGDSNKGRTEDIKNRYVHLDNHKI